MSAFWGGGLNPDGSRKRRKLGQEEAANRVKVSKEKRAARKGEVRARFLKHRANLEESGQWVGPRKFEEWLLQLAECVLGGSCKPELPEVSC